MIRRITGIVLGVLAFLLVYWITGLGTPSQPNWALAALVGLVIALIWPWLFGIYAVRRVRQNRQNEIDQEVQKQLAQQQNNPPPS
jgi:cell shape-determining protein MreD